MLHWLLDKTSLLASILGAAFAFPLAVVVDGDWASRLVVMLGAAGLAGLVVALGKFRIASAIARKTDAEVMSSQFTLIIERLQEQIAATEIRHKAMEKRLDMVTLTKHEALKQNQAMIFYIQNVQEMVRLHNLHCEEQFNVPSFEIVSLEKIFELEDEERKQLAERPVT
jgi:ribosomal protein L17